MPQVKLHHFTVVGKHVFPFDMLRYDQCWPKTAADAVAIAAGERGDRKVTLESLTGGPTEGRWRSFGWMVIKTN